MQLVNDKQGWIVAGGHLYWSADRGCHWRNITPEDGPRWAADAVFFLDPQHGWVATGENVFRTTDGGRRWQRVSVSYSTDLVGLHFVDPDNGWLASAGYGNGETRPAEPTGYIFHTTDGGIHWTDDVDSRLNGGQIRFATANTGFALNRAADVLYRSGDGGQSWTGVAVAVPPGYDRVRLALPTFLTSTDGVVPAALRHADRWTGLTYYVSHDGGRSWASTRVFSATLTPVPAVANGAAWAVALSGPTATDVIETTSDAGQAWTAVHVVGLPRVEELNFATPLVGWARPTNYECVGVGQTCTYREDLMLTVDGGRRWTTIDLKAAGL